MFCDVVFSIIILVYLFSSDISYIVSLLYLTLVCSGKFSFVMYFILIYSLSVISCSSNSSSFFPFLSVHPSLCLVSVFQLWSFSVFLSHTVLVFMPVWILTVWLFPLLFWWIVFFFSSYLLPGFCPSLWLSAPLWVSPAVSCFLRCHVPFIRALCIYFMVLCFRPLCSVSTVLLHRWSCGSPVYWVRTLDFFFFYGILPTD